MSETVDGRKEVDDGSTSQGTSRRKGTGSSDMSVYRSSAEASVRNKDHKQSVYKSSEEYFEKSCDPCKTAGDHVEAEGYCTDCEEYLCGTCFRSHSRSKLSRQHILLDKDAMSRINVRNCDLCKLGGDVIEAEGYCKDCKEYLCASCYRSHSRSKSSRHHVLVDKTNMSEDSILDTALSFAKMNIHKAVSGNIKGDEDYSYTRDVNVKVDTDEMDCFITDMTSISDTEIVLCDQHNKSLKLVDVDKNKVKDVLILQSASRGITKISKNQVAIVLEGKYQIQIVSVSGSLSEVRTIKTSGYCVGVQFLNGKLYVSFHQPVQFQILQLTGAVMKTIKPESEVFKHCILPRYFAVSLDENIIYISDRKNNKVLSVDMEGNFVSLYKGELTRPHDITVPSFGSVYLCNRDQHIVYKMTSDLREASVILGPGDGLSFPHAMCFNVERQHLHISSGSAATEYANFIRIYTWK